MQDNEKSRLTEFEFDYMHNVNWKKNKEIIPKLSDEWRMGCFKIYLNFQLNRNE